MKINLLIASNHEDYAEHLSKALSELHADSLSVSVCTTTSKLRGLLKERKYEAALLEAALIKDTDLSGIHLPLVLWSEDVKTAVPDTLKKINKYQRVSQMAAEILELYAKASEHNRNAEANKAGITAVWSPVGGVGKTTVALALASRKASDGKQVLYLNLEPFSSTSVYFDSVGKSISAVFEMLEAGEGNAGVLMQSILRQDAAQNISYFCCPDNFDDMNILSVDNITSLIAACSGMTEELIIDMTSECNERTRRIFEIADRILLVADWTSTSQIKMSLFTSQNNVFSRIKDKTQLIANKGAAISQLSAKDLISLPLVQSTDASAVYKTLAAGMS